MTASSAVRIEKIAYQGWANCYRVSNGEIELVVTGDVGPRIIRCGFSGGQNLFKEFAEQLGKNDSALEQYKKAVEIEDAYRKQFEMMYPGKKVFSRLGYEKYNLAKQRIEYLSKQLNH